jgi:hypothetical protein
MNNSIRISGYKFKAIRSSDKLQNRSGIYAILCQTDNSCALIDVGESAKVKERVTRHDRKKCWVKVGRKLQGNLICVVRYTPYKKRPGRREIEQDIRQDIRERGKRLCGMR